MLYRMGICYLVWRSRQAGRMVRRAIPDALRAAAFAAVLWFNDHEPASLPEGSLEVLRNLWNTACEVPPSDAWTLKYGPTNPHGVVQVSNVT